MYSQYESVSPSTTPTTRSYHAPLTPWFLAFSYSGVFMAGSLVSWVAISSGTAFVAYKPFHRDNKQPLYVQRHTSAAVAADQEPCSTLGRVTLERYAGNAVDAAVVVGLCLGVVNPASSGLGGGAFATIFIRKTDDDDQENVTLALDCREQAPGAAFQDMFQDDTDLASEYGGLATSVPGELHCWAEMHTRFGSLPWNQVVKMVADFATPGIVVSPYLAETIASLARICLRNPEHVRCQTAESGLIYVLTKDGNWAHHLREGDKMFNPALVETLYAIAEEGVSALYDSDRTQQIVQDIARQGGILSLDDMKNYKAKWREPLVADIGDFQVVSVPPPSSGGAAVIGTLRFLLASTSLATFPETLTQHRLVEGWKHIFAIRMSLSDPDYNTETVQDAVADMINSTYMFDYLLADSYDENSVQLLSAYGGPKWAQLNDDGSESTHTVEDAHEGDRERFLSQFGYLNDGGTSHFCVVDEAGNAVSMTTSINTYFGSHVFSTSTGILLSNTMDDFAIPGSVDHFGVKPAESNYIVPTKRPLSSMSPTLVFYKGELLLAVGASGGPKIISAVSQVIMRHLLLGQRLDEAIAHPRLHNQLVYHGASVTNVDNAVLDNGVTLNVSDQTRNALIRRGQILLDVDYTGAVQAIAVDQETEELVAVCDPRKGGLPAGY